MNPEYIDAGDIVIARFTAEGTNDGPLGSLKPTGRRMTLPFCEICHFDQQGQIVSGSCYYDQYTLLTQLGHIQALAAQPRTPAFKAPPFREARSPRAFCPQNARNVGDPRLLRNSELSLFVPFIPADEIPTSE